MRDESYHSQLSLSVIVPIYNEIGTLDAALRGLFHVLDQSRFSNLQIIIVESNSTDGSRELLLDLKNHFNFRLILQQKPNGKGSAVREAFRYVTEDWILLFDADLEYDPNDIRKLVEVARTNKFDFIIGSRHNSNNFIRNMSNHKLRALAMNIAHLFFAWLINVRIRTNLRDPFSMYKFFRWSLFSKIVLTSDRFDLDWELVILAGRMKSRFIEIPVKYTSRGFSEGKKIRFIRDPLNWLCAYVKHSTRQIDGSNEYL